MDEQIKSILTLGGTILAVLGVVFKFNHANSTKFKDVHNRIEKNDKEVNVRIDDVKDDYVKQDHLDAHLKLIRDEIEQNRRDQKENHREIMTQLNKNK